MRDQRADAATHAAAARCFKGIAADAFDRFLLVAEGHSASSGAAAALICDWLDDEKWPCGIIRASELTKAEHADLMLVLEFRDEWSNKLEDLAPECIERVKALIKNRF